VLGDLFDVTDNHRARSLARPGAADKRSAELSGWHRRGAVPASSCFSSSDRPGSPWSRIGRRRAPIPTWRCCRRWRTGVMRTADYRLQSEAFPGTAGVPPAVLVAAHQAALQARQCGRDARGPREGPTLRTPGDDKGTH